MKNFTLLFFFSVTLTAGFAQVREDRMSINKSERPALRLETEYTSKMLKEGLSDKLKSAGVKSSNSKGLVTVMGAKMVEISADVMDYYFKIEPLGKTRSVVLLSISKGYSNFITDEANPEAWENGKMFLTNFLPFAETLKMKEEESGKLKTLKNLEKNLEKTEASFKKQEDVLSKARKEMEEYQKNVSELKSEIQILQLKINR